MLRQKSRWSHPATYRTIFSVLLSFVTFLSLIIVQNKNSYEHSPSIVALIVVHFYSFVWMVLEVKNYMRTFGHCCYKDNYGKTDAVVNSAGQTELVELGGDDSI